MYVGGMCVLVHVNIYVNYSGFFASVVVCARVCLYLTNYLPIYNIYACVCSIQLGLMCI